MVLFDIDGTLLLTGGVGIRAFDRAFSELYGIDHVWKDYDPNGKTDSVIISDLSREALGYEVSHLEKMEIAKRYILYFKEYISQASKFRIMPGVVPLLKVLAAKKGLLGIATGNFKETADQKLRRAKLGEFFPFGGYGSDSSERLALTRIAFERGCQSAGKKIAKKEIVLIGDARQDVECGKALGFRTVAVATGSLSTKQLAALKPDLLLENLSDTKRVLAFIDSV